MMPSHYCLAEGGEWLKWDHTSVDAFLLEDRLAKKAKNQQVVFINGKEVHALRFNNGRTWDCINGWRKA